MGTLTPVLGTLTKTLGAVSTLATTVDTLSGGSRRDTRAQQNLALQQLQARQTAEQNQAQSDAVLQREQLQLQAAQDAEARQKALRRAIARQNVNAGASGISRSGSNEAILLGLVNDTENETENRDALDQIRFNTIDQNLSNIQSQNILERTQLAESQRLQNAIGVF